jgi:hypothetical protein
VPCRSKPRGGAIVAAPEETGGGAESASSPEQLHQLRIQVKKTRYATEFFASLYRGKKAAKRREIPLGAQAIAELPAVQRHHDAQGVARISWPAGRSLTEEQNRHRAVAGPSWAISRRRSRSCSSAGKAHSRFDEARSFWK